MSNRWSTPQDFFDELNQEFGFTLDVRAKEWNHKYPVYFSPDQDGLLQCWSRVCWMNPPYGKEIENWAREAYHEACRGTTVVCLVPARTETAWFQDYCLKGEVRRIHYIDPEGRSGRPRFGNAVVIFRPGELPVPKKIETKLELFV